MSYNELLETLDCHAMSQNTPYGWETRILPVKEEREGGRKGGRVGQQEEEREEDSEGRRERGR